METTRDNSEVVDSNVDTEVVDSNVDTEVVDNKIFFDERITNYSDVIRKIMTDSEFGLPETIFCPNKNKMVKKSEFFKNQ